MVVMSDKYLKVWILTDKFWNIFNRKIKELEDTFIPTCKPKVDTKVRTFQINRKFQDIDYRRKHK